MFLFSGFSTQSVMIRENFALEKLGRLNLHKFSPSKITRYTVYEYVYQYPLVVITVLVSCFLTGLLFEDHKTFGRDYQTGGHPILHRDTRQNTETTGWQLA